MTDYIPLDTCTNAKVASPIKCHSIEFFQARSPKTWQEVLRLVASDKKDLKQDQTQAAFSMKNPNQDHVIGIPISSVTYAVEKSPERPTSAPESASPFHFHPPPNESSQFKQKKVESLIDWMNKFSKRADSFAQGVREHVKLGPKISETVKGKLSLGARILQVGGVEKVFRQIFSVGEGEMLLKACQCYLSTTAGPIAGLLFISTEKIAFCSERSLTFTSPGGGLIRTPYKVSIPLGKINRANASENVNKPTQKYINIVTVDNFEFWFMGFVNYQKAFKHLQKAIPQSSVYYPHEQI